MTRKKQNSPLPRFARLRRLRGNAALRDMVVDVRLHPSSLILPLFVREGRGVRREVSSMPGVFQLSLDEAVKDLKKAEQLGLKAFILFGVLDRHEKDHAGDRSLSGKL